MIRSRSIPAVLSRVTGDGIHAILLVDANGELLGSYGSPPPTTQHDQNNNNNNPSSSQDEKNGGGNTTTNEKGHTNWPLDAESVGALITEVAGDYRRMGEELLLLDPQYDAQQQQRSSQSINTDGSTGVDGQKDDDQNDDTLQQQQQNQASISGGGGDESPSAMQQSENGGKSSKGSGGGANLKSLVIEMDYVSYFSVLVWVVIMINCSVIVCLLSILCLLLLKIMFTIHMTQISYYITIIIAPYI